MISSRFMLFPPFLETYKTHKEYMTYELTTNVPHIFGRFYLVPIYIHVKRSCVKMTYNVSQQIYCVIDSDISYTNISK